MRQREIERLERTPIWICRYDLRERQVALYSATPNNVITGCQNADGTCSIDYKKCDAVKFQLKEVKDGAEV